MDITYIMSGISMVLKTGPKKNRANVEYANMVAETVDQFKSFLKFEAMFNAYCESELMENTLSKFDNFGITWHADSGGLQVITLGKSITDELKNKIYNIQAKHADYAMCFDELPVNVTDYKGSSSRVDLSGRQFIVEWAEERARATGANVKKQIDVIKKMNSNTKVFLICQGNETEDFVKFYNDAMSMIPEEHYSYIAGVALSAACTGLGHLEAIKMVASYRFMKIPKTMGNKLHILGFGSLKRLYPLLILKQNGYIQADITFDTSTHAMCTLLGETIINGKRIELGKVRTAKSDNVFKHFYKKYGHIIRKYYPEVTIEKYVEIAGEDLTSSKKFNLDSAMDVYINLYTRFLIAYEAYLNFSDSVENALSDIIQNKFTTNLPYYDSLIYVKNEMEYIEWYKKWRNEIPTNRIQRFETLEEAKNITEPLMKFF